MAQLGLERACCRRKRRRRLGHAGKVALKPVQKGIGFRCAVAVHASQRNFGKPPILPAPADTAPRSMRPLPAHGGDSCWRRHKEKMYPARSQIQSCQPLDPTSVRVARQRKIEQSSLNQSFIISLIIFAIGGKGARSSSLSDGREPNTPHSNELPSAMRTAAGSSGDSSRCQDAPSFTA